MARNKTSIKHFMLLLMCFAIITTYCSALDFDSISEYRAVVGGQVLLPCNTSRWVEEDISLVIWYRGNTGIPIYTVDARSSRLSHSKQVPSEELGGRALMDVSVLPPTLKLDSVIEEDEGDYRCRVDYRKHRTQHFLVHLNVTVPPKQVIIKDLDGNTLRDIIGPYDEGDSLTLVCEAYGGKPQPSLVWYRNGLIIDDTSETVRREMTFTRNELVLSKLERQQLLMELECQTSQYIDDQSTNTSKRTSVKIDLNLKPLEVSIITPNRALSAGQRTEVRCRSSGSRPPAQISWYKGSKKMPNVRDSASPDGNATISTLSFIPAIEDNGKHLSCRADNVQMALDEIEAHRILTIYYLPQLTLALGANIANQIREGSDVYFECTIVANPWVTDVGWLFEGRPLYSDTSAGIIVSNQSLVLQKVRREHRGRYQCTANNAEGQASSNKEFLKVNFAPVCKPGQTIIYGVARNERVNISCEVEAEPQNDMSFKWLFNNSLDTFEVRTFVVNGTQSIATYMLQSRSNYGTLLCWAQNSIGKQKEPCTFSIVAAGPPNPVNDCYVSNVTLTTLVLQCQPGDNGGLRQIFHLQVYNNDKLQLHTNLTAFEMPVFFVKDLPPATEFTLNIYASNAKGKSDSIAISAVTAKMPERHARKDGSIDVSLSPIIGVLIGIVASLVIICLIIVFIIRNKVNRHQFKAAEETELNSKCVSGQDNKEKDNTSHMNLIYDKSDTFGFTDISGLDGKYSNAGDNEITNTCQLLSDHQTAYMPTVLYKGRGPDITYAELSIMCPIVKANNERLIACRSQHQLNSTQYALIEGESTRVRCSPSISSHHSIPDGCSESEVTLETPLVNSVRHKFYTHEVSNPGINQTINSTATHV